MWLTCEDTELCVLPWRTGGPCLPPYLPGPGHLAELSTMMGVFSDLSNTRPTAPLKVATMTEEVNFQFYLIVINLNSNSHTWLEVAIMNSTAPGCCGKVEGGKACETLGGLAWWPRR